MQGMKQTCSVAGKIPDSRHAGSGTCADQAPAVLACCFDASEISVAAVHMCPPLASR